MISFRWVLQFVLFILLSFGVSSSFAGDVLEENDVEKFRFECWPNEDYDIEIRFAPVRKRAEDSMANGQWSYEFANNEEKYPDNKIKLPKNAAARVDFVSVLKKSESTIGESYLWHVIVSPTVTGWGFGAHWPTTKAMNTYERLSEKRESLINMAKMSTHEGQPVHTKIPLGDIDSAGTLNSAWEDIFGKKIVSNLVYPSTRGARSGRRGYSLTFYHVPTPSLKLINDEGYKWPSFKHVDKAGKVYGFVLTPDGKCLGWNSVEIVE